MRRWGMARAPLALVVLALMLLSVPAGAAATGNGRLTWELYRDVGVGDDVLETSDIEVFSHGRVETLFAHRVNPSYSADGRWLLVQSDDASGTCSVWLNR